MAVFLIGDKNKPHKAHYTSVLTEPSSYQMTATPEEMQKGTKAIVKGKIVEGTGKCFAFAEYGQTAIYPINDENGEERYGFIIEPTCNTNVVFISPTTESDMISQDIFYIGETPEGKAIKLGANKTTFADIFAFQLDGLLFVYIENIANADTKLNYFIGKDNKI